MHSSKYGFGTYTEGVSAKNARQSRRFSASLRKLNSRSTVARIFGTIHCDEERKLNAYGVLEAGEQALADARRQLDVSEIRLRILGDGGVLDLDGDFLARD